MFIPFFLNFDPVNSPLKQILVNVYKYHWFLEIYINQNLIYFIVWHVTIYSFFQTIYDVRLLTKNVMITVYPFFSAVTLLSRLSVFCHLWIFIFPDLRLSLNYDICGQILVLCNSHTYFYIPIKCCTLTAIMYIMTMCEVYM